MHCTKVFRVQHALQRQSAQRPRGLKRNQSWLRLLVADPDLPVLNHLLNHGDHDGYDGDDACALDQPGRHPLPTDLFDQDRSAAFDLQSQLGDAARRGDAPDARERQSQSLHPLGLVCRLLVQPCFQDHLRDGCDHGRGGYDRVGCCHRLTARSEHPDDLVVDALRLAVRDCCDDFPDHPCFRRRHCVLRHGCRDDGHGLVHVHLDGCDRPDLSDCVRDLQAFWVLLWLRCWRCR